MKFSIDVVFISSENKVVYIIENIGPWQVSKFVRDAHSVIELPVGAAKTSNTQTGDIMCISER
jgi:hypothetical protein